MVGPVEWTSIACVKCAEKAIYGPATPLWLTMALTSLSLCEFIESKEPQRCRNHCHVMYAMPATIIRMPWLPGHMLHAPTVMDRKDPPLRGFPHDFTLQSSGWRWRNESCPAKATHCIAGVKPKHCSFEQLERMRCRVVRVTLRVAEVVVLQAFDGHHWGRALS